MCSSVPCMTKLAVITALGLSAFLWSCNREEPDRAPVFGGNEAGTAGAATARPPVTGSWGPGGASTGGGGGGSGGLGSGGSGLSGDQELAGRVVEFLGDDFFFTETLNLTAEVFAQAEDGTGWISATHDGQSYSLSGVRLAPKTWMGARLIGGEGDYHASFSIQDTQDGRADVPLVRRQVLLEIFGTLLVPEEPGSSAGHVVVRITDTNGQNVQGVTVAVPGASFVTYASSGSWTEYAEQTTTQGLALAGNVLAGSFPGEEVTVTASGAVERTVSVPIAADTVTVANLTVAP